MSSWSLKSIPPHDWFICLDIDPYFDHEHTPEQIFEEGFTRPIPLKERDVVVTVFFNGDSEKPVFHVETPEALSKIEIQQANSVLARILGTNIVIGLAHSILSNEIDPAYLDRDASPQEFYDKVSGIRGIGPTSAQDLMLFRERTDAVFPGNVQKGEEKGLRKWILLSYGVDPNRTSEKQFLQCIRHWKGYEAAAIEFLFVNWMIEQKKKKQ